MVEVNGFSYSEEIRQTCYFYVGFHHRLLSRLVCMSRSVEVRDIWYKLYVLLKCTRYSKVEGVKLYSAVNWNAG